MKAEELAAAYEQLIDSPGGKHLVAWIESESIRIRREAGRDAATAYGDLRYADGLEAIIQHINQMRALPKMKLR